MEGERRQESESERIDRELIELLNELRVALPGVQVLFAFLLTVPFSQRFVQLSAFEERVYYGTLLLVALATVFLIAPSAHHRIRFRDKDKRHLLFLANRLSIAGLAFLAIAMSGVVLLITHVLFSPTAAVIATVFTAAVFGWLWYGMPLRRRLTRGG